jgi:CelD/BcsL family acetyltransferase involved in cellulose biosynthesis
MHRDAMPALLRAGLLRLVALRLEGRIVAVLHALADPPGRAPRVLYLYLQGFDPACEKLSPGLVLLGAVAEQAIAEGFGVLDFLRGQERYKRFWGAVDQPAFRRVLIPPEDAS